MQPSEVTKSGPTIKRGQSKQDVQTPADFIQAFVARFGPIACDLAASPENTQAGVYFTEEQNSLQQDWHRIQGNLWLNPPFSSIEPWARKCAVEAGLGAKISMLVPASIGTDWFKDWVKPFAYVLGLSPRLIFVGHKDCYPKDLMLCCYHTGFVGFNTWRWKL